MGSRGQGAGGGRNITIDGLRERANQQRVDAAAELQRAEREGLDRMETNADLLYGRASMTTQAADELEDAIGTSESIKRLYSKSAFSGSKWQDGGLHEPSEGEFSSYRGFKYGQNGRNSVTVVAYEGRHLGFATGTDTPYVVTQFTNGATGKTSVYATQAEADRAAKAFLKKGKKK